MPKTVTDKQRRNSEGKSRRIANLKPFQKGTSGNPNGRPKVITLSEALRQQLVQKAPGADEREYVTEIARVLCDEAVKGNIMAIREIFDRLEGKPRQAIDVDMNVQDWREMARQHNLSEQDVLREAQRLIESAADSSDA